MLTHLMSGKMLLVPYDCGHNHGPALYGGKKAHWALVTGVVLAVSTAGGEAGITCEKHSNYDALPTDDINFAIKMSKQSKMLFMARYVYLLDNWIVKVLLNDQYDILT